MPTSSAGGKWRLACWNHKRHRSPRQRWQEAKK